MLSDWLASIPAETWLLEVLMLAITVWLVRSVRSPGIFALLTLPGTIAHEASHWLLGLLLGAKPQSVSLFPKRLSNGRWQLGSVGFARLRWWNAPFVAMAPMLLAPLSIVLIVVWATPILAQGDVLGVAWRLLVCSSLLQAAWPSLEDFRSATSGFLVLVMVVWLTSQF